MSVIETLNLSKSFGKQQVVHPMSLKVEQGEIFGFLGRNGAGKSTFINMLTGITIPTSGTFKLLNEGILDRVKHKIGVLPDYSSFYNNLNPVSHLKYFCKLTGKSVPDAVINETLALVGLLEHRKKKVGKFSFGMKKKLGIAQAIIHDPDLLFLDEPTSGVDAESAIHIQHLIKKLNKQGKTIFMTSHNLDEVEKMCTNIAIMKAGEIFSHGSMDELKQAFQTTLLLRVKLAPDLTKEEITLIESNLSRDTYKYEWDKNYFVVEVFTEEDIPILLKCLISLDVNVYGLQVMEPSLKEIFLEQNTVGDVQSNE